MKYNVIRSYQSEALLEKGIIKDEIVELSGPSADR